MMAGRRYCLNNKIHWKSFSRYIVQKNTLHPGILETVKKKMQDKTLEAQSAWSISTYIEQVILDMIPREDKLEVNQARMVDRHVQEVKGDRGNVRYLRAQLEEDAVQLTYTH